MKILIDPGHGGDNRGTTKNGFDEADYVLDLAYELHATLVDMGHGAAITRMGDIDMALEARGEFGDHWDPDMVLVLHVNAAADAALDGLMTFTLPGDYDAAAIGAAIGRAAPDRLRRRRAESVITKPTGWTRAAHNCLVPHVGRRPVLVELGFSTSPIDRSVLDSESSRMAMVVSLLSGVARCREMLPAACLS